MKLEDIETGAELTLLELDDLVEEYINNDEMKTPLMNFSAEEILNNGDYRFYKTEDEEVTNRIEFDVVSDFKDENTMIKVTRVQLWC